MYLVDSNYSIFHLPLQKISGLVNFERKVLDNGLRVLIHEDNSTPMVAVNVVYDVGARDEFENKTGFAHLFEHLMFGGSANAPDFDNEIQMAGGDSNAFTNNDLTNFYEILPAVNIETALWLESDRMLQPNLTKEGFEIQQKVVIEEYKETCLNQPYGDVWHRMSKLAYKVHPYRWPTIGMDIDHIASATLEDVHEFFRLHYGPNNAVLSIAGPISAQEGFRLAEKWFGDIPNVGIPKRALPEEPVQHDSAYEEVLEKVPVDALYMGFHMPGREDKDYYAYDLLSDILGNGSSSRLYRRLLKEQNLFSSIDAFITGNFDPGLIIIEGKISEGVGIKKAEKAIWEILKDIQENGIPERELQKYKNKAESNMLFSEVSILNRAINLGYYELLGQPDLINTEIDEYRKVGVEQIQRVAQECFREANCSEVFYKGNKSAL